LSAVELVSKHVGVYPPIRALATAQDRLLEKRLFERLEIPTPLFAPIDNEGDLANFVDRNGLPAVLKTRRLGYDGKGQVVIRAGSQQETALKTLGGRGLIVEKYVSFQRELSVIGVRGRTGREVFYPVVENVHHEGILRKSTAPAPNVTPESAALAIEYCRRVMTELDYVGVLALELFEEEGRLLANEIAPRVHNSGHWTIEGSETSQFENHLRAVMDLPLGSTALRGQSVMLNIIGHIPSREAILAVEGAHLHLYGKAPTEKRKVGHVTFVVAHPDALEPGITELEHLVKR